MDDRLFCRRFFYARISRFQLGLKHPATVIFFNVL